MAGPPTTAIEAYKALQRLLQLRMPTEDGEETPGPAAVDFLKPRVGILLREAIELACQEVSGAERIPLTSRVAGKDYFAFRRGAGAELRISRPVNKALFSDRAAVGEVINLLTEQMSAEELASELERWPPRLIHESLYTMAMAFCCAIDIQKSGDKKTPGTFFEYLVGWLFAHRLKVNPQRRVVVSGQGHHIIIPTDFIFDPGAKRHKFHVPVKTSTRERIIQVWAHQRVIDGTLGQGKYFGTPVIMTETKLDKKRLEVVEICLPEQWQIYQGHISQLKRVYYLDPPTPYSRLKDAMPPIEVKALAEFLYEANALA